MYRVAIIFCSLLICGLFVVSSAEAASSDLSVVKSDSSDPVDPGSTFTYTIIVTNSGPNNAQNSILTDVLPAGVTFVSAPGCTFAAGIVTCDLGNIPPPQTRTRTITVNAPSNASLITNTASVISDNPDPNPADNSDSEDTLVENFPVAVDDSYSVNEDVTLNVPAPGVLGNDTDADGDPLTAVLVSGPASGTLTLNSNGSFDYIPAANFNGVVTFTYKANDGFADSNVATVTITVNAINDNPVANDQPVTTNEDTAIGITLTASDVDGDPLTFSVVSGPTNGTLTGTAPNVTYTPNSNYNGADSFTFMANDGQADSNTATVSITVNPANDDPVANDDAYSVNEDDTLTVSASGVLANDSDPDGDSLTAVLQTDVSNGTLTLNSDGSFVYTPNNNFNGTDSFTYVASDGSINSNVATVMITVNSVNDNPVADDQSVTTNEDTNVGITMTASDADGDPLTFSLMSGPTNGVLTGTAPNVTYNPNPNYNGPDSFTFKANDGQADSNIATISITVNPVGDVPVAANDAYGVNEDGVLTVSAVGVLANDFDVDGDSLTAVLQSDVSNGTLTLNSNGSFVYTPNANYNGADSFTYVASDGTFSSNVATVAITINSVNDAPVANNDSYNVNEDNTLTVSSAAGVLSNDTDVENSTLTAAVVASTQQGSLTLNSNGSFVYTPNANFNGTDSFTYNANDGDDDSNTATVTITINSVNDIPQASDDSANTDQDTAVTVNVLTNDSDIDGDTLSVSSVSDPANGTAINNGDGTVTYTPDSGFFGTDSFSYTIDDGNSGSDTATVTITVAQVIPQVTISINDATAIEPLTGSVNATLTVSLSASTTVDVTVDFATADGTATMGSDYTANSGPITIPAGLTTATIMIQILADAEAFEGNEAVLLNLSNANGATIADGQGVITISETCLFCDDFEDGVISTQWTYVKQNWTETNGSLHGTPAKRKAIAIASPVFAGCLNCSISATMTTAGGIGNRVWLLGWYIDKKNTIELLMKEENDKWIVKHRSNGSIVAKGKGFATILPNVSYNVELSFDGTNFVLRVDGNVLVTLPAATSVPSGTVGFQAKNTTGSFGYILVN